MTKSEVIKLYEKWLNHEISNDELDSLLQYDFEEDTNLSAMLNDFLEKQEEQSPYYTNRSEEIAERVRASLLAKIRRDSIAADTPSRYRLYNKYIAAACALLIIGMGYWVWNLSKDHLVNKDNQTVSHDVTPGGNAAELILPNGKKIILNEKIGTVVMEGNTLRYQDGATINAAVSEVELHTIRVPKGGEYNVILSDGSLVRLNSESELIFPSTFASNSREVRLRGEAFFEIEELKLSTMKKKPFRVHTAQQIVEVLGTKFNIAAYPNEHVEKTTLAEGSVQVSSRQKSQRIVIAPHQQVIWDGNTLYQKDIDLDVALAWTRGEFYFQDADLKQIMRQLERWYDIEIIFEGDVKGSFGGKISKNRPLSKVVEMLEATNTIKCKIVGRRLYVRS